MFIQLCVVSFICSFVVRSTEGQRVPSDLEAAIHFPECRLYPTLMVLQLAWKHTLKQKNAADQGCRQASHYPLCESAARAMV